jgi:hypothetical protein
MCPGQPLYGFPRRPVKYYDDKSECMAVAAEKERLLIEGHSNYGYTVEKNAHTCELKEDIDSA